MTELGLCDRLRDLWVFKVTQFGQNKLLSGPNSVIFFSSGLREKNDFSRCHGASRPSGDLLRTN